jgi:type II secretory pathway component PulM
MRAWIFLAILALMIWLPGCALFDQHAKEFDTMRAMAMSASERLKDGAMGQMQVSGQALNPGIVFEAAIVYRASAKYDGLAGQFATSAMGTMGPQAASTQVWDMANATRVDRQAFIDEVTKAVLAALGKSPGTKPE